MFFSTINRNPKSYLFAVIGAEYILRLLPRGTHDYAQIPQALGTRAALPRCRPDAEVGDRHGLQPAHQSLLAQQRRQRQLPARRHASGISKSTRHHPCR